jgi:capsular exopolysaccharide synthesis family protein
MWLGSEPPKCVVVTAARPGEGKTTTAISLARVAAAGGERVILVDCDLRQPGFARVFGRDDGPGLVDFLKGDASLSAIRKRDRLTQLDYIMAGSSEPSASRLFMVEAMVGLIEKLRAEYDLVVLDAPPALAMVDARVIGRVADATLLCVRWRDTPRSVVRAAMDMLADAKANVIGALLTRVDPRSHRRSGYADAEVYHPRYGGYFRN